MIEQKVKIQVNVWSDCPVVELEFNHFDFLTKIHGAPIKHF